MDSVLILGVAAVTSAAAGLIAARAFELSGKALAAGCREMLEYVGAGLVFFVVNLTVGVIALLSLRLLTRAHVSLYPLNDVALLGLSLLQGLTFQCWRRSAARDSG